jgi:hypothetical protein
MLENEVVEEIQELMSVMGLPFIAVGTGEDKKYYTAISVEELPFGRRLELLEDMKDIYEKLNKTPWYSESSE